MPLADARAICPDLSTRPADLAGESAALKSLRRWAARYAPMVATDGPDGLMADISGVGHLFGGEGALRDDLHSEHEHREEVIQWIYDRYGRHRAGLTATVIHFRSRAAIREVGKVMGLSQDVVARLSGQIWGWSSTPPGEDRMREAGLDLADRRVMLTLRLIGEVIGFPRHLSQHVGGFVITQGRLDELCPIENAAMDDRTVIEWDKDDIDALGLLKVDVLALGMLTAIRKAFGLLTDHRGEHRTLANVPPEDSRVYDMLCRADAVGVFQVESRAQLNFLPRMRPRQFYDLVCAVAIVRPGPIQGGMVHPFINRRQAAKALRAPAPLPLFGTDGEGGQEPDVALPHMTLGEEVIEDYLSLRPSLRAHPLELLRPRLTGSLPHDRLPQATGRITVTGLVITRQRPGAASSVIFLTLEDETGVANVVVWGRVYEAFRRAVIAGRLLRVTGRIERDGQVTHLVAEQIEDISPLLATLGRPVAIEANDGRADETRRPAGGSIRSPAQHPREQARKLFPSRDFH